MSKIDWYLRSHLKFKHLQLLITLDELRHIGKTAEYLNISQPAVSKALASFEEGLNIKLFDRTTREMKPTEAGESLIRYARLMIVEMANVRHELYDIKEGKMTRISIGILPIVSLRIMPNFIGLLDATMKSTHVAIREGTTDVLLGLLRANTVDVVICNMTIKPKMPGLVYEHIFQDHMCIAVKKTHPLVDKIYLTWSDLSNYSMILPPEFAITRLAIEDLLINNGVEFTNNYIESLSILSNVGILKQTNAIGFISQSTAKYFEENDDLVILPLSLKNVTLDLGVFWLADKKITPSFRSILTLLKESVPTD